MNRNYFTLTKNELILLFLSQEKEILFDKKKEIKNWDIEQLEKCKDSLAKKKYIEVKEEKIQINSRLESWIYVMAHSKGYVEGKGLDKKEIYFFFWEDSIVSLSKNENMYELIWLPFIHLAIGYLAEIVGNENYTTWSFEVRNLAEEFVDEVRSSSEETYIEVINKVSKSMIMLHGQAIREVNK